MDESTAADREAVEAVLAGNADAFDDIVRRYQRLVASVVWRYGGRASEVDELVQDIFVKTYRNLALYRPEHAFSSWLYRLSANHVLDHLRRKKRDPAKDELPEQVRDPRAAPAAPLEERERAAALRDALADIDARYRDVLVAVYFEGARVDEAARTLGLPPGTVKTRLMRGREQLKKRLRRTHPEFFAAAETET